MSLNLSLPELLIRQEYVTVEHCFIAIQSAQENMRDTYIFIGILLVFIIALLYRIRQLKNL